MKPLNQQEYYQFKIISSFIMKWLSIIGILITLAINILTYFIVGHVILSQVIVFLYFTLLSIVFTIINKSFIQKQNKVR